MADKADLVPTQPTIKAMQIPTAVWMYTCLPLQPIEFTMAICTICSNVVVAIYPRSDELEPQRSTKTTYPLYDAAAVQSCWICAKFADWLKDDNDKAWQAWLRGPLTNVFQVETCTLIGDTSSDPRSVDMEEDLPADSIGRRKLRISSMFLWRCVDGEEAGCQIQLNFLRDTGKPAGITDVDNENDS